MLSKVYSFWNPNCIIKCKPGKFINSNWHHSLNSQTHFRKWIWKSVLNAGDLMILNVDENSYQKNHPLKISSFIGGSSDEIH